MISPVKFRRPRIRTSQP